MPSDRIVTARHVLNAVREIQRRGSTPVLAELEKLEPDLVEHLLEGLSQMHGRLLALGLTGRDARRCYHLAESTALVCLLALRQAHHDLWKENPACPSPDPPCPRDAPIAPPPEEPPSDP